MNDSTFNAIKFNEVISRVTNAKESVSRIFTMISSSCSSASSLFKSEDSNLASTFDNVVSTMSLTEGALESIIDEITRNIGDYMGATIENENVTQSNLVEINSSLFDAIAAINNL